MQNVIEMQKMQFRSLGQEDSLEQIIATHSSILAWKIPFLPGQGSLAGYSLWGHKELDMIERLRGKVLISTLHRVSRTQSQPTCIKSKFASIQDQQTKKKEAQYWKQRNSTFPVISGQVASVVRRIILLDILFFFLFFYFDH